MEISNEVFSDIKKTLEDCNTNKEDVIECEAVLNSKNLGFNVTEDTFKKLYKSLCKSKEFEKRESTTLDITSKSQFRLTIDGKDRIQEYCENRKHNKSTGELPENIIKHEHTKVIKKERVNRDSIQTNFYFRINVKKENPVENSEWKSQVEEHFRYKNRFSFQSRDPFKIDLTIVRSGKSFEKLGENEYEVEIEFIPTKEDMDYEDTTKKFCKLMYGILRIVFGVNDILTQSENKDVLDGYKRLLKNRNFTPATSKEMFLSYKPITLERSHLRDKEDYFATDKADGERNLLYVTNGTNGNNTLGTCGYLINDRLRIKRFFKTDLKLNSTNCIIDGELITEDKFKNKIEPIYMAFDMYFENGTFCEENFEERYKNLDALIASLQMPNVKIKQFFGKDKDKSIFQTAYNKIWVRKDAKDYPYSLDGLIFQPKEPLPKPLPWKSNKFRTYSQTWNQVYKWKPSKENTIDMLTIIEPLDYDTNGGESKATCKLYVYDNRPPTINPLELLSLSLPNRTKYKDEKMNEGQSQYELFKIKLPIVNIKGATGVFTNEIPPRKINNNDIVEYSYESGEWKPYRIRQDKTEQFKQTKDIRGTANAYLTADSILRTIQYPVTEEILKSGSTPEYTPEDEDKYYDRSISRKDLYTKSMAEFHGKIKRYQLTDLPDENTDTVFDIGVGKGGDINKYVERGFGFVVGADQSKDNIILAKDSAWSRYLRKIKKNHGTKRPLKTDMIFLQLDASEKWDTAYFKDLDNGPLKKVTTCLFGIYQKPEKNLEKYHKRIDSGFDLVNCQFALHYFFKNEETLRNFCHNVDLVTKPGGLFIGTCFKGSYVEKLFEKESDTFTVNGDNDRPVLRIKKKYADDSDKVGRRIDVYVESINKETSEYLVYFDTLERVLNENSEYTYRMEKKVVPFEDLFKDEKNEMIKEDLNKKEGVKRFSFLNVCFAFRKEKQKKM